MRLTTPLPLFLALLLAASWGSANAQPFPQEDHFKVYEVPEVYTFAGQIMVMDQWDVFNTNTLLLDKFATPVQKNNEPILFPERHQTWWEINQPEPTRKVWLENQFGPQVWFVHDARYLVVPASKNVPVTLPPLNHYKCYEAEGDPLDVPVTLTDQFDQVGVRVLEPTLFCNPAEKVVNGIVHPIEDPFAHLACYRIDPPMLYGLGVMAFDQFGDWQVTVDEHLWLCVPTIKVDSVPAEPSTWGGIKARYQ